MSKIKKAQSKVSFPEMEKEILKFWEEAKILDKSIDQRSDEKTKTFYDGPITANGKPHHGHMLTFAMKDIFPRYWSMKGFKVSRSLGWDCQGIPVEYEVEKKLGFKEKKNIEKYGVAEFNKLCRESVMEFKEEIIRLEKRMGRLTNNDEEYATMDASFIESIWWSLKELYEKGLLYEGFKVVPYSTRAGTTLSNAEVALGGYEPYDDPAVTVKFELVDEPGTYVLAWTTTPWTLPTNFGLAIGEKIDYVKINQNGEKYILAKECVESIFGNEVNIESVKREDLIGKSYKPLFNFFPDKPNAYKIVYGFHVTTDSGTGVVHLAPYGVEDIEIFKEIGIEPVDVLDGQGDYTDLIPYYTGMNYRDANPKIVEDLKAKNLLFKYEDYTHDMPMCWRTKVPLIYKPITSWYIATSTLREKLVNNNEKINWTPAHVKHGRFGNWLAEIKDWGISRSRYWGTPLPVWKSESGRVVFIGSFEELEKFSGKKIDDPHRPYIDEVEFDYEGEHYKRIPDVIDVWYDSGAMPFARFHYPFENKAKFEKKFPADYISESVDQTRGWFYSLHAIATCLFDSEAFKNVVMSGFVLADDGSKLSKSKKNYTSPEEMINKFGADALRASFFSTPICAGEDTTISSRTLRILSQELLIPLWNIYVYFSTYAELHNWEPNLDLAKNERENHVPFNEIKDLMDKWLLAYLQKTIKESTDHLEKYEVTKAIEKLNTFSSDISKWYIRRNRDRFVNGDTSAQNTLYYVYLELLKLYAPFMPFITEKIYQELAVNAGINSPESIHLCDYPEVSESFIDWELVEEMNLVRDISSLGQNLRTTNALKVRQPLARCIIVKNDTSTSIRIELLEIIKDELNVKEVLLTDEIIQDQTNLVSVESGKFIVYLNTKISDELKEEGLYSEIKRQIQNLRKTTGLQMGETAKLQLNVQSKESKDIIEKKSAKLKSETGLSEITFVENLEGVEIKIDSDIMVAKLEK